MFDRGNFDTMASTPKFKRQSYKWMQIAERTYSGKDYTFRLVGLTQSDGLLPSLSIILNVAFISADITRSADQHGSHDSPAAGV